MSDDVELMQMNERASEPGPESVTSDSCDDDDDIEPLSGKPFFDLILSGSNVGARCKYHLILPKQFAQSLPEETVPVTLICGGRSWETSYLGNTASCYKRFDHRWRAFVEDNELRVGDACVFELIERSDTALKFKIIVLRGDFPSSLLSQQKDNKSKMVKEEQTPELVSANSSSDDEIEPLTGKPFFDTALCKSHIFTPYQLTVPSACCRLLPNKLVPSTLTRGKRRWKTTYLGEHPSHKKLEPQSWKNFVVDNKLKVGDFCIFEIMVISDTSLEFKVQVLRGDFPAKLLEKEGGSSSDSPIVVE